MPQPGTYEPDQATIATESAKIREQRLRPAPSPQRSRPPKPPRRRAAIRVGREQELVVHGIVVPPLTISLMFDRPVKVLFEPGFRVFLKRQKRKTA